MRLVRESVIGVALLALAACADKTAANRDVGGGARNAAKPDGIDRDASGGAKVTLAAAGIGDTVYFDYDKTTLRPDALPALQRIAAWMKQYPAVQIRIAGHADERGTREYNLALGDRRAATVRSYLVSLGIPPERLETMSYGKERPVAVGSDEASWAKNRRAVAEIE
jgi:peptidoglycan-associated lipoprotein